MMPGLRLSLFEREEIALGVVSGESVRSVARRLGRSASTVSRELARNGDARGRYQPLGAHRRALRRARRPRALRLQADAGLAGRIGSMMRVDRDSPATVSNRLAREGICVSHETIYRHVYRGGFGDPTKVLNRPRTKRRRRTRTGRYPMVLGDYRRLATRPGDVLVEAGHWEGDLIVGADNQTAAVVITERQSRICLLGALPKGRNSDHVTDVVCQLLERVPSHLRRSLTWDQGRELTRWQRIEDTLGLPVYFAQPRSPWQRPLVENQNAVLRRWLPKRTPIPRNQPAVDIIATRINSIPRRILSKATAQEAYDRLAVATTS
jgi:transposase, IS30 family